MSDREQGALADWLAALDDGLTGRLACCTLCQRQDLGRWGVCGEGATICVSYALCRMHDTAAGIRAVEALFGQRYAASCLNRSQAEAP